MPIADGDIGWINGEGDIKEEGEPGKRLNMSMTLAAMAFDRGDGTADPIETYKGRSSSGAWAKKQTRLAQLEPSLQSRVRY